MWPVTGITVWAYTGIARFDRCRSASEADELERSPWNGGDIHCPLLIFHGALDTTATTEELKTIQTSVLNRGGTCELIVFDDDTHALMRHRDEIHARILNFLGQFR
jgi:dipeptidyl aminopeptidase/acylaminoacyl peptidase